MLRLLLLAVALTAAAGAAMTVQSVAPEANATNSAERTPPLPVAEVLVAAVDLTAGSTLRPEDLRWQVWPADAANPTFIRYAQSPTAPQDYAGMVLRAPMRAGTPLLSDQVGDTASGFLSAVLTPGMRAVAIPVSAERTAGGFILPNNRVDVLLATGCEAATDGCETGIRARTILRDVRVLAIDQAGQEQPEGGTAMVGKTATLELSPRDAETLVAAEASGRLSLILRSVKDEGRVEEPEAAAMPEAAPAAPPPAAAPPVRRVRVLRAGVAQYYDLD